MSALKVGFAGRERMLLSAFSEGVNPHVFVQPAFYLCASGARHRPLAAGFRAGGPDLERKIGTTVADSHSADYRFSDLRFTSADGRRHYRVRIAQPHRAPEPGGYPTVYFLDGNAVLMELNALLAKLAAAKRPPVLVAIGYDNDLRIDAAGRATTIRSLCRRAEDTAAGRRGRGCVPAID